MINYIITTLLVQVLALCHGSRAENPDINLHGPMSAVDIIRSRGFLVEEYAVKLDDMNNLYLYRIINPLANPKNLNKYPVLHGHGVLFSAASMISRSERSRPRKPILGRASILGDEGVDGASDESFPFMLSNNNFDVWIFDSRGTNRDFRNTSLELNPTKSNKYWTYSLDDQALTDVPIFINFVLAKTNAEKLVYVGYSESTMFWFMLMSTAPEYQEKIAAFVALAPVSYVGHVKGVTLTALMPLVTMIPDNFQVNVVPQPIIDMVNSALRNFCRFKVTSSTICAMASAAAAGVSSGDNNPHFFNEFFKSTSIRALKQFMQLAFSNRFGMYDYGVAENMRRYGQALPPAYDLSKIKSDRIILARGLEDYLATPPDQERLIKELGAKPYRDLAIRAYNHFDFIDGKDIVKFVNGPALTAIYELMYKDGPNILRNALEAEQVTSLESKGLARRILGVASDNIKFARNQYDLIRNPEAIVEDIVSKSANLLKG